MSVPTAKIICDSISPDGIRLTTMEVKMHRFVLAEMNTHRVFTRNSASSRAIPVAKMLIRIKDDPAMPVFWGKNQPGMGATEELDPDSKQMAINIWLIARDQMIASVERLQSLGVHKQLTNRLIEPWMWHTAIISSTEWSNFFGQRCSINPETKQPYAQPEMYECAMAMQHAYYNNIPKRVYEGGWHLPYITEEDCMQAMQLTIKQSGLNAIEEQMDNIKKITAGRCARVSYLTHDGKRDILEDIKLANKLASATPMHPSPFEHVATPQQYHGDGDIRRYVEGNFRGWHQYRHSFKNENINNFTPDLPIKVN